MSVSIKIKNTILNVLLFVFLLFFIIIGLSVYIKHSHSFNDSEESDNIGRAIQVIVLNGTTIQGLASKFGEYLREKDFDVVFTGNYQASNVEQSFIIDHTNNKKILRKVLRTLNIHQDQVKKDVNESLIQDVTIVIGKDYQKLIVGKNK